MRTQIRSENSNSKQSNTEIEQELNQFFHLEKMEEVDYFPHLGNPSYEDMYGYSSESECSDYESDYEDDYESDYDDNTLVGYGVEYDNDEEVKAPISTIRRHIPKQFISEKYSWKAPRVNVHFPKHHFPALVPSLRPEKTIDFKPTKTTLPIEEEEETPIKTRVCKFHLQCRNAECSFAHNSEEYSPVECKFGKKCKRKSCNFFHPTKETKTKFLNRMKIDFTPKIEAGNPRSGSIVYAF